MPFEGSSAYMTPNLYMTGMKCSAIPGLQKTLFLYCTQSLAYLKMLLDKLSQKNILSMNCFDRDASYEYLKLEILEFLNR